MTEIEWKCGLCGKWVPNICFEHVHQDGKPGSTSTYRRRYSDPTREKPVEPLKQEDP